MLSAPLFYPCPVREQLFLQDTEKIPHIRTENTQYSNYTPPLHFVNEMAIFAWPNLFIAFYCTLSKNIRFTAKFPLGHTKKSRCPRQKGSAGSAGAAFCTGSESIRVLAFYEIQKTCLPRHPRKRKKSVLRRSFLTILQVDYLAAATSSLSISVVETILTLPLDIRTLG